MSRSHGLDNWTIPSIVNISLHAAVHTFHSMPVGRHVFWFDGPV